MATAFLKRWTVAAAASLALAAGIAFGVGGTPTQEAKLLASNGTNFNSFGRAAAIAGDTAVVGAEGRLSNQGAAYVFTRSGTTWTEQAMLTAPNPANQERFGRAVAIVGDTALVGRPKPAGSGAVFVFTRAGTTWTPQGTLPSADPTQNDNFGASIAFEGDTAVVGAYSKNSVQGAVYVFTLSGTTWTQQQKLTASDAADNDLFGISVALSGDTLVAGAYGRNASQGAAYVFTRTGTTWTEQAKLTAAIPVDDDRFGTWVALSGDTAVAGAPHRSVASFSRGGAAFVFTRTGTTWTQQAELTAADAASSDRLGEHLALEGDTLVAAAQSKNSGEGAAYLFEGAGTAWTERAKMRAGNPATGALFGSAIALDGGTLIAGMGDESSGRGTAYVIRLSSDVPPLGFCLPTKVTAKANAASPAKSSLTVSGILDTGPGAPSFSGSAELDAGGFSLDIPAFVAKGSSLTYSSGGISLTITPSKKGSSRATFSVKAVGDLAGKVDLNGPLALRFRSADYDVSGTANLAAGKLAPHGVTAPLLGVLSASAKTKGTGKDSLKLKLTFATDGVVPAAGEDLRICFGDNYTSPVLAGDTFVKKGNTWTYKAKKPGITKATVDYVKGTITISGTGLDLGPFLTGGNTVAVTIVRGGDRTARIRMVRAGTKLTY